MALDETAANDAANYVMQRVGMLDADATPQQRWKAAVQGIFAAIAQHAEVKVTITDGGLQTFTISTPPGPVATTPPVLPQSVDGIVL